VKRQTNVEQKINLEQTHRWEYDVNGSFLDKKQVLLNTAKTTFRISFACLQNNRTGNADSH
jgi:hypothetical protein